MANKNSKASTTSKVAGISAASIGVLLALAAAAVMLFTDYGKATTSVGQVLVWVAVAVALLGFLLYRIPLAAGGFAAAIGLAAWLPILLFREDGTGTAAAAVVA